MQRLTAQRGIVAAALAAGAGLGLAWISGTASVLPPPGAPVLGDARLAALVHLAADLVLWGAVLALVRRCLSPAGLLAFAAAGLAFAALSALGPRPIGIPLFAHPPASAAPAGGWALLGWPFPTPWAAILIWLPSLALLLSPRRSRHALLLVACAAAGAAVIASACAPASAPLPFATEALFAALLLNAVCLAVLGPLLPVALYVAATGIALVDPGPGRVPSFSGPPADAAAPADIHTGDYAGPWIGAQGALVQVRIQGRMQPPGSELYLRTRRGRRIEPLQAAAAAAPPHWRRVNFPWPGEPFQLIARQSPGAGLRFTDPVPIARAAWLAGKLLATWPYWIAAAGLLAWASASTLTLRPPRAPWLPWVALLAYAAFFSRHIDSTAGPNDSGGYLNSAWLIAHGSVTAAPRLPLPAAEAAAFSPRGDAYAATTFVPTADGRLAPAYPVGFPLLVAAAGHLLPWAAAVPALILLQLVAGVVVTYLVARAVDLPRAWSALAAAIIGLSAVYLFQALQPQSDGPALVWVTLAMLCALRDRPVAAGLSAALAVLIRPADSVALVPLALCFARTGGMRPFLRFILAGLPGAIFLAWYNHRLFGHVLTTGYGAPAQVGAQFGLRYVPLTLRAYARWLPYYFTPVVALAPAAPFLPSIPGRTRLVLAAWAFVFAAFYAAYWCTNDRWYNLRFLLPAAPALVILGLWTVRAATRRRPLPFPAAALATAALLALAVWGGVRQRVTYWMRANEVPALCARWTAGHLPANAVILARAATGPLMYYTRFPFVRTDSAAARSAAFYAALRRAGRPIYAVTYHWEQPDFQWGRGLGTGYPPAPGRWLRRAAFGDGQIFVWERSP